MDTVKASQAEQGKRYVLDGREVCLRPSAADEVRLFDLHTKEYLRVDSNTLLRCLPDPPETPSRCPGCQSVTSLTHTSGRRLCAMCTYAFRNQDATLLGLADKHDIGHAVNMILAALPPRDDFSRRPASAKSPDDLDAALSASWLVKHCQFSDWPLDTGWTRMLHRSPATGFYVWLCLDNDGSWYCKVAESSQLSRSIALPLTTHPTCRQVLNLLNSLTGAPIT